MAEKNLYLFAGEHYMVRKALSALIASLDIPLPEINVTGFKDMPDTDTLIEACAALPMMAEKRLVYVADYTALCGGGSETDKKDTYSDDAKKLLAYLGRMPETTRLALCCEGSPDKRRALYKRFAEVGVVREFPPPKEDKCAAFAVEQAKAQGVRMNLAAAALLVRLAGCDYATIENEIAKLALYVGPGEEIKAAHVQQCASRTLDYNVFELHELLIRRDAGRALALLADVLSAERPEGLVGLFAKKFRDMFKVRSLMDIGWGKVRIAETLKMKEYPVQMLMQECAGFSREHLKAALGALANLDYAVKSGEADAMLAMTKTLFTVYAL
jgi:DNA polymerase-3 subunit delta